MAYPTDEEVAAFCGVTDPSTLSALRLSVIAEFERRAGWAHFLSTPGTRYFSCAGDPDLWLDCGLLAVSSLEVDGVAMVENTDYELWPYNARPAKKIRFRSVPHCEPRGIVVTGEWGYAAACPPDVRLAIMNACRAASEDASSGGAVRITQGPVTIDYGTASALDRILARTPSFAGAIQRYRFRTL